MWTNKCPCARCAVFLGRTSIRIRGDEGPCRQFGVAIHVSWDELSDAVWSEGGAQLEGGTGMEATPDETTF